MKWRVPETRKGRTSSGRVARLVGIAAGFLLLYVATRSAILIGDAQAFIARARAGDPAEIHYGEPGHFLQVPLARGIWRALGPFGAPVTLETIFIGLSLAGTLAAIVCMGLIAAELLGTEE